MSLLRLLALVCLAILAAGSCRPRPEPPTTVDAVRLLALAIDADSAEQRADAHDVPGLAPEGAHVTLFRSGGKLVKVSARLYSESGQTHEAYYLYAGWDRPFLVTTRFYWYDDPLSRRILRMHSDSLYYAPGDLLRASSQESTFASGKHLSTLFTPTNSVNARLRRLITAATTTATSAQR